MRVLVVYVSDANGSKKKINLSAMKEINFTTVCAVVHSGLSLRACKYFYLFINLFIIIIIINFYLFIYLLFLFIIRINNRRRKVLCINKDYD